MKILTATNHQLPPTIWPSQPPNSKGKPTTNHPQLPQEWTDINAQYGWPPDPVWTEADWTLDTPTVTVYMAEARSVQVCGEGEGRGQKGGGGLDSGHIHRRKANSSWSFFFPSLLLYRLRYWFRGLSVLMPPSPAIPAFSGGGTGFGAATDSRHGPGFVLHETGV